MRAARRRFPTHRERATLSLARAPWAAIGLQLRTAAAHRVRRTRPAMTSAAMPISPRAARVRREAKESSGVVSGLPIHLCGRRTHSSLRHALTSPARSRRDMVWCPGHRRLQGALAGARRRRLALSAVARTSRAQQPSPDRDRQQQQRQQRCRWPVGICVRAGARDTRRYSTCASPAAATNLCSPSDAAAELARAYRTITRRRAPGPGAATNNSYQVALHGFRENIPMNHAQNKIVGKIVHLFAWTPKILVVTGKSRRYGMAPAHTTMFFSPET